MFKIEDWVLTPAGKRLQVVAVITGKDVPAGKLERVLLSDQSVYDTKFLKPAN